MNDKEILVVIEEMQRAGYSERLEYIAAGLRNDEPFAVIFMKLFKAQEENRALKRRLQQVEKMNITTTYIKTHRYYGTA